MEKADSPTRGEEMVLLAIWVSPERAHSETSAGASMLV